MFTELCQKSWSMKKCPAQWTQSLVIPIPKIGNLRKCKNYRTLSLISHSSKIMLRIILNRLNPQVECILSDEQAGFRKGKSTVEQIFNCRILMERHIESQRTYIIILSILRKLLTVYGMTDYGLHYKSMA